MARKAKKIFEQHEVDAWSPPIEETPDAWAERCLVLPRGVSSMPGPLSLELTPYLREPLRAVADPRVEEIIVCSSSQVGKTTWLIAAVAYIVAVDPWNAMVVMPNEDEALELKSERFEKIILESPELAKYIHAGGRAQFAGDTIDINGATVTFRGSRSPSGLASKPVKAVAADEINKWDRWTGGEADPLDLVGERMKTFHDRKFMKSSTPTTQEGRISVELEKSTNERYFVPCPHCGGYQVLVFGDGKRDTAGIKWPEGLRDAERIEAENLAWYECGVCHDRIDEADKRQMVMRGVWAPHNATVDADGNVKGKAKHPRRRGFHIWAGYSLWPGAAWSKIVGTFLRAKGSSSSMMNFRNSWLAETWQVTVHELKEQHLIDKRANYVSGTPPKKARVLTAGVDVQSAGAQTYQYFVIRAWGANGETWLVREGLSPSWDHLYSVLIGSQYTDREGAPLPIECVLIDSGYKTDEVYQFCELYGCWAAKGDVRGTRPYTPTEAETAKGSGRWLRRVNVHSDYYKSHIHGLIRGKAWHLPEDVSKEYLSHMTAEQLVSEVDKKTGRVKYRWQVTSPGRPNHYLDCDVLAHCAGAMLELGHRRDLAKPTAAKQVPVDEGPPVAPAAPAFNRVVSKVFRR